MAWCPRCKLEYVDGIKICPDCKTALVASLEDASEDNEFEGYISEDEAAFDNQEMCGECNCHVDANEVLAQIIDTLKQKGLNDDEISLILDNIKNSGGKKAENYKPLADKYTENRSGSSALILCGAVGIIVLLLNLLGVIRLPLSGYSFWLTTIVMGVLFLIFLLSGVKALLTAKKLAPEVDKEKEDIEKLVTFLKEQKKAGRFDIAGDDLTMEEQSLVISNMAVSACESEFEDLAPGFAFYVTDRYYSEIFENEDED